MKETIFSVTIIMDGEIVRNKMFANEDEAYRYANKKFNNVWQAMAGEDMDADMRMTKHGITWSCCSGRSEFLGNYGSITIKKHSIH